MSCRISSGRGRQQVAREHRDVGGKARNEAAAFVLGLVHVGAELGVGRDGLARSRRASRSPITVPCDVLRVSMVKKFGKGSMSQTGASLPAAGLRPRSIQVLSG